ncbi:RNA-directed DNA polymerase, eukaryota [Tanacetum coccineum]|uniref:RNA-directed DNA polymerase, eukaryota n=1 Tax=Tanacetum coccineum TaxID=301880 RepID=A0ABQ5FTV4_9ASTR
MEQSAFIKGRQILDGPFILNEVMIFYIGLVLVTVGGSGSKDALRLAWIVERGQFLPIQVGNSQKVTLSNLFYADDAIFIGKWSHDNVISIARLLQCFYMASGLNVNFHKSTLLGIDVPYHKVERMASNVGCKAEKMPFNYLGVKVGENMSRIESWREKVGDGQGTRFWLDKWVGDQTLKDAYPRIFALELDKDIKVVSKLEQRDGLGSYRRLPRGGIEEVQMMEMRSAISLIILSPAPDTWVWTLDGSRSFTVGSARRYIDKKLLISGSEPTRWCKVIPQKVNILAWRISLDKLPTRINLDVRGFDVPSILCPICDTDVAFVSAMVTLVFESSAKEDAKDCFGGFVFLALVARVGP